MRSRPKVLAGVPDDRLDLVFHALADRTRRSLLARLAEGPAAINVLAEPFDMSRPAISKHLRVLEEAGLIERNVEGRTHLCALGSQPLRDVDAWLAAYRAFWAGNLRALARYVEPAARKRR